MGFAKLTKIAFATIAVATMLTSAASAQPFQKPIRWLGEGFSAGYHRCNPGPDVDYYNPWNAHNSMLISNLPQFQQQNYQSFNLNNLESRPIYQGVPFSVYAAPSRAQHGYGTHGPNSYGQGSYHDVGNGDMVESSFEPLEEDQIEDVEEEQQEEQVEEEPLEDWQDDENEWMEEKAENDQAILQAPSQPVFSKTSFPNPDQNQSVPVLEGSSQDDNLFNPFPGH